MNSRTGFGSIILHHKVLSYATRNIGCRFCAIGASEEKAGKETRLSKKLDEIIESHGA